LPGFSGSHRSAPERGFRVLVDRRPKLLGHGQIQHLDALSLAELLQAHFAAVPEANRVAIVVRGGANLRKLSR
jgi:hypothetical protein